MNLKSSNTNKRFADRLVSVESPKPGVQEQLRKELHDMFIRELSNPRRIFFGIVATIAAISGLVCIALALTEQQLPMAARIGLGVGSLFGFAWAFFAGRVCWSGNLDLRIDAKRMAQMVWVFTVLMMTFFMYLGMSAKDRTQGILMIVYTLPFMIGAGVYWLNYRIEQTELVTREKLLELELQVTKQIENSMK